MYVMYDVPSKLYMYVIHVCHESTLYVIHVCHVCECLYVCMCIGMHMLYVMYVFIQGS
jgi:hypothetical protein